MQPKRLVGPAMKFSLPSWTNQHLDGLDRQRRTPTTFHLRSKKIFYPKKKNAQTYAVYSTDQKRSSMQESLEIFLVSSPFCQRGRIYMLYMFGRRRIAAKTAFMWSYFSSMLHYVMGGHESHLPSLPIALSPRRAHGRRG